MRMTDEQIIEILETLPINYYTKSNDKVTQVYDRANSATYIDMVKMKSPSDYVCLTN